MWTAQNLSTTCNWNLIHKLFTLKVICQCVIHRYRFGIANENIERVRIDVSSISPWLFWNIACWERSEEIDAVKREDTKRRSHSVKSGRGEGIWIHPTSNIRQDPHACIDRWTDMSCEGSSAKLMRLCLMRYRIDANGLVIKRSLMRVSTAKSGIYQSILIASEHDPSNS